MGPIDFLLEADLSYKIGAAVACCLFLLIAILLLRMGRKERSVPAQPARSIPPQQVVHPPPSSPPQMAKTGTTRRPTAKRECPSCHFQNFEDALFCSMCGFSFVAKEDEKKAGKEKMCIFCTKPMPLDAPVCPSCKKSQGSSLGQLEEEKKRIKGELRQIELRYASGQIDPAAYRHNKEQLKQTLLDIEDKITEEQVHRKLGKD